MLAASSLSPSLVLSPPPIMETLPVHQGRITVIREDLLPGGTKQRACGPFFAHLAQLGYKEIVYASPFAGFAQVAIAVVANHFGLHTTLYCEKDQTSEHEQPHEFTKEAAHHGACITLCQDLQQAHARSQEYAAGRRQTALLPLGLDCPPYRDAFSRVLKQCWHTIQEKSMEPIRRLWLPVGSGTLARTFLSFLPNDISVNCLNVRVLKPEDERITQLVEHPQVTMRDTLELFHEPNRLVAPVPSNAHYDAKLWRFIVEEGRSGDVWWNVAR